MTDAEITVLYADDDEPSRREMERSLRRRDEICVRTVTTGDDALAYLEATDHVDCVVCEYRLPGLAGRELIETIRDRWHNLPIVVFTEARAEAVVPEAIGAGVTDYLRKGSVDRQYERLADRICDIFAQQRSEAELKPPARRHRTDLGSLIEVVEEYAVSVLDTEGCVRTWNDGAERMSEYDRDQIVGRHVSTWYCERDRKAGVPQRDLRTAAIEGAVEREGWRVGRDGTAFWADVSLTALRHENELVGFVAVTREVS
jgi:PAS domain S-box-containing protein